jgi:hypothetical protein
MRRWLFEALVPLIPNVVRERLVVQVIDGPWPHWLRPLAPWALGLGLGSYPQRVREDDDR